MLPLFNFEVHTPFRLFYSGRVESVSLALADGDIGIYANHSPFSAPARSSILRLKDEKGVMRFAFITDGILEVKEHKTVLMVDTAEWPEEIDTERALAAKKASEEKIESAQMKFEIDKAKARLRRSEMRLKAAALKT
ncbi:MAG: ATP synthase F1 subunit epsilon [Treponema sp.]|nr:ATP synthase F1 subunit epsilon [Treponema sp.]